MNSTTAIALQLTPENRRAFTLMELVIVLLLMVGLLAVVWPNLMKPLQRTSLDEAAQMVRDAIDESRYQASLRGVPYFVLFQQGSDVLRSGSFESFLDASSTISGIESGSPTSTTQINPREAIGPARTSDQSTMDGASVQSPTLRASAVRHWHLPSSVVVANIDWTMQSSIPAQNGELDAPNSSANVTSQNQLPNSRAQIVDEVQWPPNDPLGLPIDFEMDNGRKWWLALTAEGRGRDAVIELVDRSIGQRLRVSYSAATGALEISR